MTAPSKESIREANAHIMQIHQRMVDQEHEFQRKLQEKDVQISLLRQQLGSRDQLEATLNKAYDTIARLNATCAHKDTTIANLTDRINSIRLLTNLDDYPVMDQVISTGSSGRVSHEPGSTGNSPMSSTLHSRHLVQSPLFANTNAITASSSTALSTHNTHQSGVDTSNPLDSSRFSLDDTESGDDDLESPLQPNQSHTTDNVFEGVSLSEPSGVGIHEGLVVDEQAPTSEVSVRLTDQSDAHVVAPPQ
jgi:hypothetical protein